MGNQAALSSLSGVPQGCLFGAEAAVNVCKSISKEGCMVLSDASNVFEARMRSNASIPLAFFSIYGGSDG